MDKGVLKSNWDSIMSVESNNLRSTQLVTAHLVMQVLAWMWSVIFAAALGSYLYLGVSLIAHTLLLGGVFATAAIFKVYGSGR